jgi:hypothetical protein
MEFPNHNLYHCLSCQNYDIREIHDCGYGTIEELNFWTCENCGVKNEYSKSRVRPLLNTESNEYVTLFGEHEIGIPHFIKIRMPDYQKEKDLKEKVLKDFISRLIAEAMI